MVTSPFIDHRMYVVSISRCKLCNILSTNVVQLGRRNDKIRFGNAAVPGPHRVHWMSFFVKNDEVSHGQLIQTARQMPHPCRCVKINLSNFKTIGTPNAPPVGSQISADPVRKGRDCVHWGKIFHQFHVCVYTRVLLHTADVMGSGYTYRDRQIVVLLLETCSLHYFAICVILNIVLRVLQGYSQLACKLCCFSKFVASLCSGPSQTLVK